MHHPALDIEIEESRERFIDINNLYCKSVRIIIRQTDNSLKEKMNKSHLSILVAVNREGIQGTTMHSNAFPGPALGPRARKSK